MFKRKLSLLLIISLIFSLALAPTTTLAKPRAVKEAEFAAKVKTDIAKLGVGPDARIEVKLRDKTKLKGYISEADAETFSITDLKTGGVTVVAYPNVVQVKGNNLSTGAIIAISVGAAVGVTLLVIWLLVAASD